MMWTAVLGTVTARGAPAPDSRLARLGCVVQWVRDQVRHWPGLGASTYGAFVALHACARSWAQAGDPCCSTCQCLTMHTPRRLMQF